MLAEHHQLGGLVMHCVNVLLQLGAVQETLFTDLTSKRINIRMLQLMFGKLNFGSESLQT